MSSEPTPSPTDRAHTRRRTLIGLALIFAAIGLGYLLYWLFIGQFYATTDDAYVRGNLVVLTARVPGTVTTIAADNTNLVREGQPLVRLDNTDMRIRLEKAKAALALAIRQARASRAMLISLRAQATARRALYKEALGNEQRRQRLIHIHAISAETWAHVVARTQSLKAQFLAAKAQVQAQIARVGHGPIVYLPRVQVAIAAVRKAYANNARCLIRAPVTGYVAKRHVQVGQHVTPGQSLLVIIPLHQLWVTANYKEDALGALRLGQPATITTDIYGDTVTYAGHVIGIGAGTGSAFALLPPTNASGNWIKIVQRIPVRISLPLAMLQRYPLRVGLSATVTVNIHNTKGLMLPTKTPDRALYHTTIYGKNMQAAQHLIDRILKANGARRGV